MKLDTLIAEVTTHHIDICRVVTLPVGVPWVYAHGFQHCFFVCASMQRKPLFPLKFVIGGSGF